MRSGPAGQAAGEPWWGPALDRALGCPASWVRALTASCSLLPSGRGLVIELLAAVTCEDSKADPIVLAADSAGSLRRWLLVDCLAEVILEPTLLHPSHPAPVQPHYVAAMLEIPRFKGKTKFPETFSGPSYFDILLALRIQWLRPGLPSLSIQIAERHLSWQKRPLPSKAHPTPTPLGERSVFSRVA